LKLNTPPKIALFGGSFDPVHFGHLAIAEAAQAACGLDRVFFLPCWQSPHKRDRQLAAAGQRIAMLELALRDLPWADVCRWEIERQQTSYSWRTAEHFAAEFPGAELFWILGADQWRALPGWAEPDRLAALLHFIVFPRGTEPQPQPAFRHVEINLRHPASSTEIRHRLTTGEPTTGLLDPQVADLIQSEQLYSSP